MSATPLSTPAFPRLPATTFAGENGRPSAEMLTDTKSPPPPGPKATGPSGGGGAWTESRRSAPGPPRPKEAVEAELMRWPSGPDARAPAAARVTPAASRSASSDRDLFRSFGTLNSGVALCWAGGGRGGSPGVEPPENEGELTNEGERTKLMPTSGVTGTS